MQETIQYTREFNWSIHVTIQNKLTSSTLKPTFYQESTHILWKFRSKLFHPPDLSFPFRSNSRWWKRNQLESFYIKCGLMIHSMTS